MRVGFDEPLAKENVAVPRQRTRGEDTTSLTPTSIGASGDDDNLSDLHFMSQTSSNNMSAFEREVRKLSPADESGPLQPMPSFWTGVASSRRAPSGFDPLASISSTNARPLSPIVSARQSRFPPILAAAGPFGGSGSRESRFFPDYLLGGLVSATSGHEAQRQKMNKDVTSYVDAHYAAPKDTVTSLRVKDAAAWEEHIDYMQFHIRTMPSAVSGNAANPLQAYMPRVGHVQRSNPKMTRLLSADEPDGAFSTQLPKSPPTIHNPRAAPFVPRYATTIENLEQVAQEYDDQRSLTVTRPRSSWDQVPNWRSRVGCQGVGFDNVAREPAACLPSGHPPAPGRGHMSQGSQSLSVGPSTSSNSPLTFAEFSSRALTTSQSQSSAHGAIGKRDTRRTFEPFRPMNAVLNPDAYKQPLSEEDIAYRLEKGISPNYRGNHENPRNVSARIPDSENCAVWITSLPANCTVKDLLRALMQHRPGRVWATHISRADPPRHPHAAAKIVFYHPSEAKRFLQLCRYPGIWIQGHQMVATHNKQRVPAQEYTHPTSRALEIRGDKKTVSEHFLRSLFKRHFKFEDEAIEILAEFRDVRVIEWRFGSMRAQASSAYQLLERHYPNVDIRYATDPCAQYLVLPPQEQSQRPVTPAQEERVQGSGFDA